MLSHEVLLLQNDLEDQFIIADIKHKEHKGKDALRSHLEKETGKRRQYKVKINGRRNKYGTKWRKLQQTVRERGPHRNGI